MFVHFVHSRLLTRVSTLVFHTRCLNRLARVTYNCHTFVLHMFTTRLNLRHLLLSTAILGVYNTRDANVYNLSNF